MTKPVQVWNSQAFRGLTGTASVQFVPFDFSSFGVTSQVRCVLEVECVALASNDAAATYPTVYSAQIVFTWNPTGNVGTVVKKMNEVTDGTSFIAWNVSGNGTHGSFQVQAVGQGTTNTFDLCCAARIGSFLEYGAVDVGLSQTGGSWSR